MEEPLIPTTKVISISQDYLILGKSTRDTEIRINVIGDNYEESKLKVENMIRLAAYAEGLVEGNIAIPKYIPKNHIKMKLEGDCKSDNSEEKHV